MILMVRISAFSTRKAVADIPTVDICITTEWTELEGVCMIADLLARREYL